MNHYAISAAALLIAATLPTNAQLTASGTDLTAVDVPQSLGYTTAYVVRDCAGAMLTYDAGAPVTSVERFSALGAAYAEPVSYTADGSSATFAAETRDMGYRITTSAGSDIYMWVVNYAAHPYTVSAIAPAAESDDACSRTLLSVEGSADQITIYGISGRPHTLDREIILSYRTLVYDADADIYRETIVTDSYESLSSTIAATAPLCDTQFTLQPDRFATLWNLAAAVVSPTLTAVAVDAHTSAEQTPDTAPNQQHSPEGGDGAMLGGSAPCEINFHAVATDAAIYRRWEISDSPDFEDIIFSYDQTDFTHTFTEAGTTYVRFTANNAAGTCPYESSAYTISIGESSLLCPNAFSPGAAADAGGEWRVSYRSIVEFHCEIFNRWGHRLATLTNPAQGWDGIIGGKPAASGVYFYVIKARGADGRDYRLSGDINVISARRNPSAPTTGE